MPPKETAPLKTPSVPVRPLKWTRSGYSIQEIAGGFQDFIELQGCGPVGLGWGGAGRWDASKSKLSHPSTATSTSRRFALPLRPSPLPTATWKTSNRRNWAGEGDISGSWEGVASLAFEFPSSQSGSTWLFFKRKAPAGCFEAGFAGRLKVIIACKNEIRNRWSKGSKPVSPCLQW